MGACTHVVNRIAKAGTELDESELLLRPPSGMCGSSRLHPTLKRPRMCRWTTSPTAILVAAAAFTVISVSAFQPSFLPRRHSSWTRNRRVAPYQGLVEQTGPLHVLSVADGDLLMLEKTGIEEKPDKVRFNGLTTSSENARLGRRTATLRTSQSKAGRSRSSTMPGFAGESDRQRAYRDGVRLVEARTGKKVRESAEARKKRRKESGEAMYKNSAVVPDSLVRFAKEIHEQDLITSVEEKELGEKTQEAIRLQNLYDNLELKLNREPTDEEWCAAAGKINMEAIRQAIDDGLEAKNTLVTSNLRMVQSVINTYIRNGLSAQYNAGDLMQEGILALIRAAEKFEPDRGWKFSTYAMYWVRASVKRSQVYQSRIITVPQRLYENHKRLLRVERELRTALGRNPTRKELGDATGMSETQVNRCFRAMEQRCFSLDQEIANTRKPLSGDVNKETLIELVESKTDDRENNKEKLDYLRESLIDTLNRHLSPDEVELLLLRYGLKDGSPYKLGRQLTIAELSRLVGLKPDKVRRTINKSLKQLQAMGIEEWLAYDREFA